MATPASPAAQAVTGLQAALKKLEEVRNDPARFQVYENDPVGFARDVLGVPRFDWHHPGPGLTDEQVEFLEAVARNDRRVSVRAGHGVGKSFVLGILALWWYYCRRGRIVTTATTWSQVESVLWGEIKKLHRNALVPLPGILLDTEIKVEGWPECIGLSTREATAFQGRHDARLLVIVDEAPGVDEAIFEAIFSLATGERNCVVLVGNPTESAGSFYQSHRLPTWTKLHFNCLTHPNVVLGREVIPGACTRPWVEEQKERYGEDSPIYGSRVLGEFPVTGMRTVIPLPFANRGMDKTRYAEGMFKLPKDEPVILGLDVARYGSNRTVLAERRGQVITRIDSWAKQDTMTTVGEVVKRWKETKAQLVVVDEVGLGAAVLDRLLELDVPAVGYHSGKRPGQADTFVRARDECWWRARERLEAGTLLLPIHPQLLLDLTTPRYKLNSAGKIEVERKEELEARGVESPDFADAVMMTLLVEGDTPLEPFDEETLHNRDWSAMEHQEYTGGVSDYAGA